MTVHAIVWRFALWVHVSTGVYLNVCVICVHVLLSREEREDLVDDSKGTAPGGSIRG